MTAAALLIISAFALRIPARMPAPASPLPSESHIEWQKRELLLFIHFGLKTFCVSSSGLCEPSLFAPDSLDVTHWIDVARDGGFRGIILVAKHDDGFCLWQTSTTDYGVASSLWKDGEGDIVGELADAAHKAGLWFGVYISCWDRHFLESGRKAREYANYFATQWRECMSNYGKIDEVWFDGNNSGKMVIDWDTISSLISELQPRSVIFGGKFSDTALSRVAWPGNEDGNAGEPNWSVFPAPDENLEISDTARWMPAEADATLQGNWFWNDTPIMSPENIKLTYLNSVGRGGVGLFNVAPNPSGRFDDASVGALASLKAWTDSIYASDLATGGVAVATSVYENDSACDASCAIDNDNETFWAADSADTLPALEIDLGFDDTVTMFFVQEHIPLGQRIAAHTIQYHTGRRWKTVASGMTIGYRRIHRLETPVTGSQFRLVINSFRAPPCISGFSIVGTAEEPAVSCSKKRTQPPLSPIGSVTNARQQTIHISIPGEQTGRSLDDIYGTAALRLDGRVVGPAQKILYMQHGAQYRRHVAPGFYVKKKP